MNSTDPIEEPTFESEEKDWTQGFFSIMTSPSTTGLIPQFRPMKTIFTGTLIYALCYIVVALLYSMSDPIRHQNYELATRPIIKMAEKGNIPQEQVDKILEEAKNNLEFKPASAIGVGLFMGISSIMFIGLLFWIFQRMFNANYVPVLAIAGVSGYGAMISGIGLLINGLIQFFTSSFYTTVSLGVLVNPLENFAVYSTLANIDPFSIWKYIAIGIAVAVHTGQPQQRGVIFGLSIFVIVVAILGGFSWVGSLFM